MPPKALYLNKSKAVSSLFVRKSGFSQKQTCKAPPPPNRNTVGDTDNRVNSNDNTNVCDYTLRLLFYYALPTADSSLKYRLVRHNWKFNIHESLHTEVSCVISNTVTGELGLNVEVRNENKPHHPLMSELYINTLALYCDQFKLNKEKFYLMNQMEINAGLLGERCLKSTKTASFQCRLLKSASTQNLPSNIPPQDILKTRLSYMDVMPMKSTSPHVEQNIPKMSEIYSFLANHETIYFNTNITTEEFNNIVASYEPHTTLAVCWTAAVVQNSIQRLAYGQHFVQLKYLYEKKTCPLTGELKQFRNIDKDQDKLLTIAEFGQKKSQEINEVLVDDKIKGEQLQTFDDDEDDFWEPNDTYVGQRCLLEDETFLVATKA